MTQSRDMAVVPVEAIDAFRAWYFDHTGKRIFASNAEKAVRAVLQALANRDAPGSGLGSSAKADPHRAAEGAVLDWQKWTRSNEPPLDGEWFVARAGRTVRVVHYDDKHDRLPIDHTGWVWPTEPTHWALLRDFSACLPVPPAINTTAGEAGS